MESRSWNYIKCIAIWMAINAFSLCQSQSIELILNKSKGFKSNDVYSTFIDSQGYLWIAGDNGVYRYDGKNFIHYSHILGDNTSLLLNQANCFSELNPSKIVIGLAGKGISIFDKSKNEFSHPFSKTIQDSLYNVFDTWVQNDSTIWVSTHVGVHRWGLHKNAEAT